ncbi:hypothetical protein CWM27_00460 [Escherichia coli]|nr:hypothetical protein CWM23_05720 [Escherichia coli]PJX88419.1 hypothetical protein CWM27_00460 [Escherichia coli]PJX94035.1 hypothetical protein CWM26_00115 [Escherichia coli]PJY05057.1 hypothetical protein CWM30_00060 [Escherichia coli]PJY10563.1 hypothetical protein CWM29_00110 [Escherichia coli]
MDSVHHIWCPLFSQEFQDLPDGAETTLTKNTQKRMFIQHCLRAMSAPPSIKWILSIDTAYH